MLPYKFISESRVCELLEWEPVIDAVEHSLKGVSTGCAFQSSRIKIVLPESNLLYSTPGYLKDDKYGALASRVMTKFPNNKQESVLNANISLMDEHTGVVKSGCAFLKIIQGNELTDWRTAAVSLVATKYLHKEKPKKILAIISAGKQGRIHAVAFQKYFKFQEGSKVTMLKNGLGNREKGPFDRTRQAKHFSYMWQLVNGTKIPSEAAVAYLARTLNDELATNVFAAHEKVSDCVKDADVIVTAATAKDILVKDEWVKKGAHINAISVNPVGTDLDQETYRRRFGAKFLGQVGDVIVGSLPTPEVDETSIFQSLGMAVEDCALARLIYDLDQKPK